MIDQEMATNANDEDSAVADNDDVCPPEDLGKLCRVAFHLRLEE